MAMVRQAWTPNVYLLNQKSMMIKFYAHSRSKRAIDFALVDSGATENFMNLQYAQYLKLSIHEMKESQMDKIILCSNFSSLILDKAKLF